MWMDPDLRVKKLSKNSVLMVKDVSALQSEKIYSYPYATGGCCWCVGVSYKGNKFDDSLSLSLSLAVVDAEFMPCGWNRHAQFSFTIVNQISEETSYSDFTETQEWFDHKTPACDCATSIPLGKLGGGFILNGQVKIVAEVKVLEAIGIYEVDEDLVDFYGFPVYPSEMELVSRVLIEHPDFALDFLKEDFSFSFKRPVVSALIFVIKDLRKPLEEISRQCLVDAHRQLVYVTKFGLNVGWLEKELSDLTQKKEKDQQEEIDILDYPE